jgi:threonine/homoserine/homoserine lactone efflux protein
MTFWKGFFLGVVLCAPVGPVGLLCMSRTLLDGRTAGIFSLLGACTVDLIYCCIAGFGITCLSDFLERKEVLFHLLGGGVLVVVGVLCLLHRPVHKVRVSWSKSLVTAFSSTFFLMLANPMPILVYTAAFALFGTYGWDRDPLATALLSSGVFVGSMLWGPVLVAATEFFMHPKHLRFMDRVSGFLIIIIGLSVWLRPFL